VEIQCSRFLVGGATYRQEQGYRAMQSNVVDGLSSPKAISEIFADKYMNFYNSVSYSAEHMQMLHYDIENSVARD
jgi:hypothetical protein